MEGHSPGPLGVRLALAFVAVAVLAVALVAGLAVVFSYRDISVLLQQRQDDLTRTPSLDAISTYNTGQPGWSDVDLKPALDLAASSGTEAAVLDQDGRVVATNLTGPRQATGVVHRALILGGRRIGTLLVRFSGRGLAATADNGPCPAGRHRADQRVRRRHSSPWCCRWLRNPRPDASRGAAWMAGAPVYPYDVHAEGQAAPLATDSRTGGELGRSSARTSLSPGDACVHGWGARQDSIQRSHADACSSCIVRRAWSERPRTRRTGEPVPGWRTRWLVVIVISSG